LKIRFIDWLGLMSCLVLFLPSWCLATPDPLPSIVPEVPFTEARSSIRPIFLSGIKGTVLTHLRDRTVVSGPPGLTITDYGLIEWIPPISQMGERIEIELGDVKNGSETIDVVTISVLAASRVSGRISGKTYEVTDKGSQLKGYIFRFEESIPPSFTVWEVSRQTLPSLEDVVSTGFYVTTDSAVEVLVPTTIVLEPEKITSIEIFTWVNTRLSGAGGWTIASLRKEGALFKSKSFVKFKLSRLNYLSVVAVN